MDDYNCNLIKFSLQFLNLQDLQYLVLIMVGGVDFNGHLIEKVAEGN